jgi:hypothetical protein
VNECFCYEYSRIRQNIRNWLGYYVQSSADQFHAPRRRGHDAASRSRVTCARTEFLRRTRIKDISQGLTRAIPVRESSKGHVAENTSRVEYERRIRSEFSSCTARERFARCAV